MRLYYVRQAVRLKLPHKCVLREAPTQEQLETNAIPGSHVFCGAVAWEVKLAKRALGDENVVELPFSRIPAHLLPAGVRCFDDAGEFSVQVKARVERARQTDRPLKIAILNGFGTMLGDTALGAGAFNIFLQQMELQGVAVEATVFLAWNARPDTAHILNACSAIHEVVQWAPSLRQLKQFDVYFDFTRLLAMPGYNHMHSIDFYLNAFGLNYHAIPDAEKRPFLPLSDTIREQVDTLFRSFGNETEAFTRYILVHPQASTPVRSMPDAFFLRLVHSLFEEEGIRVVLAAPTPSHVLQALAGGGHFLDLSEFSSQSLDHFAAIVNRCDYVISVDTLAVHAAVALGKPGYAFFTTIHPALRLAYAGNFRGELIHDAISLPCWEGHKAGDDWATHAPVYEQAWEQTSLCNLFDHAGIANPGGVKISV